MKQLVLPQGIRLAGSGDVDALAQLCTELGYPSTPAEVADRLSDLSVEHAILVSDDGNRLTGFIHVAIRRALVSNLSAEICALVVTDAARGTGIGATLVTAAEDWAKDKGLHEVNVRSNVIRERAHSFYHRLGYKTIKTQHAFRKTLT